MILTDLQFQRGMNIYRSQFKKEPYQSLSSLVEKIKSCAFKSITSQERTLLSQARQPLMV